MKRLFSFLGALSLLILFQVSCTNLGNSNCFIHYTADTPDALSLKAREKLEHDALYLKSEEQINSVFNHFAGLSYEEYGGAIPKFSQEYNLDTLVDENGWITLKLTRKDVTPDFNLIYIHGGAYFFHFDQVLHAEFCEALLSRLNAAIYMPLYPLAPKHKVMESMNMLMGIYNDLQAEKKSVYIMGDSAGASLALCFTLYLKDLGIKLPDAIFPISPMADFTLENPEIEEYEKRDPMLSVLFAKTVYHWLEEGMSLKDPKVSPIYGDLKGMPRTFFFVGSDDLLCPDALLLYDKMKAAGVEVGMLYGKSLWHDAPNFKIPVQDRYLDEVAKFIGK